jgi:superfamily I DNA/RNA helicase
MLENLNEKQIEAVKYKDGPLLILAGARVKPKF